MLYLFLFLFLSFIPRCLVLPPPPQQSCVRTAARWISFMWHTRSADASHQMMWLDVTSQFNILPAIFKQGIPENNRKHVRGLTEAWLKSLDWASWMWPSKRWDQPLFFSGYYCQITKLCRVSIGSKWKEKKKRGNSKVQLMNSLK